MKEKYGAIVNLEDLVGIHVLTGVDFEKGSIESCGDLQDCQVIRFCLDGITYLATEDPDDGYRSRMDGIIIVGGMTINIIPETKVYAIMKPHCDSKNKIIQFYDTITNKIVLEIGTGDYDDYYPYFVANWNPENLCHNSEFRIHN